MTTNEECLPYADHLQAEHRELHQRLRNWQSQLNHVEGTVIDGSLLASMQQLGQQLRRDLVRHFAEEENGGCLEYACSRVPGLSSEAGDIVREHPQLISQLDKLLAELAAAQPNELPVALAKEKFEAFAVRLLAHESRENRVVERGFNMELE